MERWYYGRMMTDPGENGQAVAFALFRQVIREMGCSDFVPEVRFSRCRRSPRPAGYKKTDWRPWRYVYLGIEAEREPLADYLQAQLFGAAEDRDLIELSEHIKLGQVGSNSGHFEPGIWSPTRGYYRAAPGTNAAAPIPVIGVRQPSRLSGGPGDALADPGRAEETADLDAPLLPSRTLAGPRSRAMDRLLAWLSAAGAGSWPTFVRVCDELGLPEEEARRLLRRLALLGHVEVAPDGRRWEALPPALVELAAAPGTSFWTGGRTTLLDGEASDPQPGEAGPPRRLVPRGTAPPLPWIIREAVTERLVGMPDLAGWLASLEVVPALGVPVQIERWQSRYRDTSDLRVRPAGVEGHSGLYRLKYRDDGSRTLTGYWDAPRGRFVRGDWYGLRFLCRVGAGERPTARWVSRERCLLVPSGWRFPLLFERVLVQASGLLPEHDVRHGRLVYTGVPEELARALTRLLRVDLRTEVADGDL
jgi:hypothetical protein